MLTDTRMHGCVRICICLCVRACVLQCSVVNTNPVKNGDINEKWPLGILLLIA